MSEEEYGTTDEKIGQKRKIAKKRIADNRETGRKVIFHVLFKPAQASKINHYHYNKLL